MIFFCECDLTDGDILTENIREQVHVLEANIVNGTKTDHIATQLGCGAESVAFRLRYNDDIVVKFPVRESTDRITLDPEERKIWASEQQLRFARGLGCSGIEQLVEYYPDAPMAVLTKYAGPWSIDDVLYEGISVTQKECEDLLQTAFNLHSRGLSIDNAPSNLLYSREQGFTIIDYKTAEEEPQSYQEKVRGLADMFIGVEYEEPPPQFKTLRYATASLLGTSALADVDARFESMRRVVLGY